MTTAEQLLTEPSLTIRDIRATDEEFNIGTRNRL